MRDTKKMYLPLVDFLEKNLSARVGDIFPDILTLTSMQKPRGFGPTFIKDADGVTVAVECYYFKRWFPLVGDFAVKFEVKSQTASGYNRMCEEGFELWTEGQRVAKAAHDLLLKNIAENQMSLGEANLRRKEIEAVRRTHVEATLGFDTREDVIKHLHNINILPKEDSEDE